MIAGGWAAFALVLAGCAWAGFWIGATCWAFGEARACIEEARREHLRRSGLEFGPLFEKPRKLSEGGYDC